MIPLIKLLGIQWIFFKNKNLKYELRDVFAIMFLQFFGDFVVSFVELSTFKHEMQRPRTVRSAYLLTYVPTSSYVPTYVPTERTYVLY